MVERDDPNESEKRKKRLDALQERIGSTDAGYKWLLRVEQIGKLDPAGKPLRKPRKPRKESKDGEDTSST